MDKIISLRENRATQIRGTETCSTNMIKAI